MNVVLRTCLSTFVLPLAAGDPQPELEIRGSVAEGRLGRALAAVGDLDGDAVPDLLIGCKYGGPSTGSGPRPAGSVWLVSGADGTLLDRLEGAEDDDLFGQSLAPAGDLDDDGVEDFVVGSCQAGGATMAGRAVVYSGRTRRALFDWRGEAEHGWFGRAVAPAGDADDDGVPDLLVGAPVEPTRAAQRRGQAFLYSGRTGEVLHEWTARSPDTGLGWALATVGDLDQDGHADAALAEPRHPAGGQERGCVQLVSGRTGEVLGTLPGEQDRDQFGSSLAGGCDLDGDGSGEFLVGAILAGRRRGGGAYLYSGTQRTARHAVKFPHVMGLAGFSVALGGDWNGDGTGDFAVGGPDPRQATGTSNGQVEIYSGRTGELLQRLREGQAGERFGVSLSFLAGRRGPGSGSLGIGAYLHDGSAPNAGRVVLFPAAKGHGKQPR